MAVIIIRDTIMKV